MFRSKYIFETKRTKFFRYFKNTLFVLTTFLLIYLLLGISFIRFSDDQRKFTEKALFNNPPDLIVVFTGGKGRIQTAFEKSFEFKQPHIFITGVYSKLTVEQILKQYQHIDTIDPNSFEIDYEAHNTIENVISTLRYIKQNSNLKKVMVISSDYHIMRIKHIINTIKLNTNAIFFFYGIPTDFKKIWNIKMLYIEVYKFLKTWIFLTLWGVE
ncbi:MAG: hypothetical protein A2381_01980 [Bdellovibrionales bacterium RIFOXYB1_FULL_37_110]|nr:MAG: hypothetical protein A2417_13285 [Bdellovibrionales bacterium RIFOXYC1_FULL_37_79]OFZ59208.1 MAG: hypothetical protein A2381_01980 [Bdellovibrionales bacterium RIFOXYB1_FULL_37_110]OFZ62834.1 MAG: hypothetical protein A2577_10935 [Bdellovibrionales bacterium RIFOXYD1_FULL_36_51]